MIDASYNLLYSLVMKYKLHHLVTPLESKTFHSYNLVLESTALKANALKDSPIKHNFILAPIKKTATPVVFHLSGYFSNGTHSLNQKTLEDTWAQQIATATEAKKIPLAVHVFVDAMTGFGGSQFINSSAFGKYSDYLQDELYAAVQKEFELLKGPEHRCLLGASSGGYGALHHVSLKDSVFGVALVNAPDSDFETSLLPDLYKTAPHLKEFKTVTQFQNALKDGTLKKKKNFFDIMNTMAMSCSYSELKKGAVEFPIDLLTGDKNKKVWEQWLSKDPVYFLAERAQNLKNKFIDLEVGIYDEFSLYFGARKIKKVFQAHKIQHSYLEFVGGHFGSSERKLLLLERWGQRLK